MWGLGLGFSVRGLRVRGCMVGITKQRRVSYVHHHGSSPRFGQKIRLYATVWVCLPEIQGGTRLWAANLYADNSCTHPSLLGTVLRVQGSGFRFHVSCFTVRVEGGGHLLESRVDGRRLVRIRNPRERWRLGCVFLCGVSGVGFRDWRLGFHSGPRALKHRTVATIR